MSQQSKPTLLQDRESFQKARSRQFSPKDSDIWQLAIERYYDELQRGGIVSSTIDEDLWNIQSPMDLLEQIQNLESADAKISRQWLPSLRRLEPILLSISDFVALTAWAMGMDGKVAAVVWGSIRLILKVNLVQSIPKVFN